MAQLRKSFYNQDTEEGYILTQDKNLIFIFLDILHEYLGLQFSHRISRSRTPTIRPVCFGCYSDFNTFSSKNGRHVRQLFNKRYGHKEWVTTCAHLSDGRILSGGMDSLLCLWDKKIVKCSNIYGHRFVFLSWG